MAHRICSIHRRPLQGTLSKPRSEPVSSGNYRPNLRENEMKRITWAPAICWFTTLALLVSMCLGLFLGQGVHAQSPRENQGRYQTPRASDYPPLAKYASDLTPLAQNGKLEPARDHGTDITRLIEILSHSTDKAPVILSESDLDRDAIVRGLAIRIVSGEVPAVLYDTHVFRL